MGSQRSTWPKSKARQHYVELGELVVLEQIRSDAKALDDKAIVVGPFVRLDAGLVAAREGKTRGVISNLFGSQAAFQAEIMDLALSAEGLVAQMEIASPADFDRVDLWLDAFLLGQSALGPKHNGEPAVNYAALWALWLSAVPYGLWSERISRTSMQEYAQRVELLGEVLAQALERFDRRLRSDTSVSDLACAMASMIEGVWLNQCLTGRHPVDPAQPISTILLRSGRMIWNGATEPADGRAAVSRSPGNPSASR